jgi:hypothetical protein
MRRISLWSFALAGLLGLFTAVPVAQAQLRLVAQQSLITDITITPPDPTVVATNESPEIFALDVPAIPSSGYVLFTSSVVWQVDLTADTPIRANFQLRLNVTSPALPTGIVLRLGVPITFFRNNTGTGGGFQGGTSVDAEALTRKLLAGFLLGENPSLTEATAAQIADDLFKQGFHVSVFARLRSQNVSDATVTNPNVAFFAEPGSPTDR